MGSPRPKLVPLLSLDERYQPAEGNVMCLTQQWHRLSTGLLEKVLFVPIFKILFTGNQRMLIVSFVSFYTFSELCLSSPPWLLTYLFFSL